MPGGSSAKAASSAGSRPCVPTPSQLVGREEEIEILLRRWTRARAGNGQIVLLSGEAGIGKSRLVKALEERLVDPPRAQLGWFCSPYHQDSPLYPLIAALERDAGLRREHIPERRLAKLEAILPSATAEETALIAALLSIPTGDRLSATRAQPSAAAAQDAGCAAYSNLRTVRR